MRLIDSVYCASFLLICFLSSSVTLGIELAEAPYVWDSGQEAVDTEEQPYPTHHCNQDEYYDPDLSECVPYPPTPDAEQLPQTNRCVYICAPNTTGPGGYWQETQNSCDEGFVCDEAPEEICNPNDTNTVFGNWNALSCVRDPAATEAESGADSEVESEVEAEAGPACESYEGWDQDLNMCLPR